MMVFFPALMMASSGLPDFFILMAGDLLHPETLQGPVEAMGHPWRAPGDAHGNRCMVSEDAFQQLDEFFHRQQPCQGVGADCRCRENARDDISAIRRICCNFTNSIIHMCFCINIAAKIP